jgi:fructokinase
MKRRRSKSGQQPSVLGTGLLALDVVMGHQAGCKGVVPRLFAGGTCGNVLAILAYLGWRAYPIARLNGDPASEYVLQDLRRWQINLDFVSCGRTCSTPVVIEQIGRDHAGQGYHRFSFRCPCCGAWLPTYRAVLASAIGRIVPKIEDAKVFFFDRASRGALDMARACAARGALIVFEPSANYEARLLEEAIGLAHILKYSDVRFTEASASRTGHSPLLEIQTRGSEGLYFRSRLRSSSTREWQHLEAYDVAHVTDAAGAGDWCAAVVIEKLGRNGLKGFKTASDSAIVDALRYGQAAAAWNCAFEGARGGMYCTDPKAFHDEVNRIMKGNAPKTLIRDSSQEAISRFFAGLCPACRRTDGSSSDNCRAKNKRRSSRPSNKAKCR